MTEANLKLIEAIEKTASKLATGAAYQWGHMGVCNCGNLAQELTKFSKSEIHQFAMQRFGDWKEQILDYCPTSGFPMDLMISRMLSFGLTTEDLTHLESLSDPKILAQIPAEKRNQMRKNTRDDVILYLGIWAKILKEKWVSRNDLKLDFGQKKKLKSPALVY